MQNAGAASTREASPPGAPFWAVAACLLSGAVLPALVYWASRSEAFEWIWHFPAHQDSVLLVALGLAGVVALALLVSAGVARRWGHSAAPSRAARVGRAVAAALLVAGAGALLVRWPHSATPGDWATWGRLADDPMIMPSEPLGRASHYLFYRVISETPLDRWLRLGPKALALRLSAVAAGMVYLTLLLAWARRALPRSSAWTSVLFLFATPMLVLYAGYLETTPWAYAFTGAYLLAGLRYLNAGLRRPPWPEALLLMLAVGSHGVACFVTGAHALLCLHWFFAREPGEHTPWTAQRLGQLVAVALLPFVLIGAAFVWTYHFGLGTKADWYKGAWYGNALGGPDKDFFVAFSDTATGPRHQIRFGSREYLIGLLNVLLFACPLLLVLPAAIRQTLRSRRRPALFLLAGFAGLFLITLFFHPDLGYRRDFDLLALCAVPASMLIALWWDAHFSSRQRWLLALGIAASSFVFLVTPTLRFP
jgi:hypothetical protein